MSHTIFLIIALVTTGIFLIQFVLSIFFGDIDVDVDADISSVVSFKGLTHFGIGFGWYMYLVGNGRALSPRMPICTSRPRMYCSMRMRLRRGRAGFEGRLRGDGFG